MILDNAVQPRPGALADHPKIISANAGAARRGDGFKARPECLELLPPQMAQHLSAEYARMRYIV